MAERRPAPARAIVLGGDPACPGGTYLLRIRLSRDVRLAFGRFGAGRRVGLCAGTYAYVGSAMAARGAACLGHRLLRHATRTGGRRPHALRAELAAQLLAAGLLPAPRPGGPVQSGAPKHLRWHVDYLLDQRAATLCGVIVWRSAAWLEQPLAAWLVCQAGVRPVAPGLGAGDDPGATHLLAAPAEDAWWAAVAAGWGAGYLDGHLA